MPWERDYVSSSGSLVTKEIVSIGRFNGKREAEGAYPYAVSRNEAEVRRLGEQKFSAWEGTIERGMGWPTFDHVGKADPNKMWRGQREEAKRLFTSAFTVSYLEYVQKEDEKRAPQPQQAAQPATNPTGARATLKDITRTPTEDLYIIELTDPGHLDEPQLVYVHVGDGEPQQPAASSGSFAASSYSSSVVPLPSQPSYSKPGTGKVQHIYLKRKK
jgi:hypothetical protein